jgi:hypothetical protein
VCVCVYVRACARVRACVQAKLRNEELPDSYVTAVT